MIECLTPWALILNLFQAHSCGEIYSSALPTDPATFEYYLPFLIKTFILELPIYYLFLKSQAGLVQNLKYNTILNLATHPMVFFGWPELLSRVNATYLTYLLVAEIFAPTVESLILIYFFKISYRRAIAAAITANLLSWSIGVYWT